MFSEIHGLPLHPLAVHAAVVAVPLAALLGILFVIPRTRAWSRIPLVVVSVGAFVSVFVARQSGQKFKEALGIQDGQGDVGKLIQKHEHRAGILMWFMLVFAIIAIVAYFLSRDAATFTGAVALSMSGVIVVAAVVVAFQTYLVGDIGSRAVWNPSGTQDYSNK
jgi:hypothetical protein